MAWALFGLEASQRLGSKETLKKQTLWLFQGVYLSYY